MSKRRARAPRKRAAATTKPEARPPEAVVVPTGSGSWIAPTIVCVVATAAYLGICATSFHPTWSDENVHMYVADQVAHGERLYSDIHSARPPLAIGFLVGFLKLGLSPLAAARTAVAVATLGAAGVVLWGGRRLWGNWVGVAAYAFMLLSPEVARLTPFTGIHTVALGATACAILALVGSPLWSGIVGGLAVASGQHALPIVGLVFAYLVYKDRSHGAAPHPAGQAAGVPTPAIRIAHRRRGAPKYVLGAIASLCVVVGVAVIAGGSGIYEDLIGRHLYHFAGEAPSENTELGWFLRNTFEDNLVMVGAATLAVVVPLLRTPRRFGPEHWLCVFTLGHLAAVLAMSGGLPLYAYVPTPLWALVAGVGVVRAASWLVAGRRRHSRAWAVVAAIAVAGAGWWDVSRRFSERDRSMKTTYSWIPHLRFQETRRSQNMIVARQIADDIAGLIAPDETIFGHATIAALVALYSGRRVSAQLADLPARAIEMNVIPREQVVRDIERDRVKFYVTPRWFLLTDPFFRDYVTRCYKVRQVLRKTFDPEGGGIPDIWVLEHTAQRPCQ